MNVDPAPPQQQQESQAYCAVHPEAPAVFTCGRCGNYGCTACDACRADVIWCVACEARAPNGPYASWFAIGATIVGFFGLGCALLSPVAFLLAAYDLIRIRAGTSPRGGMKVAAVAMGLSVASAVLWITVAGYIAFATPDYLEDPYADPYSDPYDY